MVFQVLYEGKSSQHCIFFKRKGSKGNFIRITKDLYKDYCITAHQPTGLHLKEHVAEHQSKTNREEITCQGENEGMRAIGNLDMAGKQDSGTALISTSPMSTRSSNSHTVYMQSFLTSLNRSPVRQAGHLSSPELPTRSTRQHCSEMLGCGAGNKSLMQSTVQSLG